MAESKYNDPAPRRGSEGKQSDGGEEGKNDNNSALTNLFGKREDGDLLSELYPFYQSTIRHGLEDFFAEHAHKFDPDAEEHKLNYTDVFNEYEERFEFYLKEFIDERDLDPATFYSLLRDAAERSTKSSVLVKLITAQTDFDFFVNLMKDKARDGDMLAFTSARSY